MALATLTASDTLRIRRLFGRGHYTAAVVAEVVLDLEPDNAAGLRIDYVQGKPALIVHTTGEKSLARVRRHVLRERGGAGVRHTVVMAGPEVACTVAPPSVCADLESRWTDAAASATMAADVWSKGYAGPLSPPPKVHYGVDLASGPDRTALGLELADIAKAFSVPVDLLDFKTASECRALEELDGGFMREAFKDGAGRPILAVLNGEPVYDAVKAAEVAKSRDALATSVKPLFPEGTDLPTLPGDAAPPTSATSVLHDLTFIAERLEVAQFQIAFTPGGADAGSVANDAHVALQAVNLLRRKLEAVHANAQAAVRAVSAARLILEEMRPHQQGLDGFGELRAHMRTHLLNARHAARRAKMQENPSLDGQDVDA